jgi:hypothetical protein
LGLVLFGLATDARAQGRGRDYSAPRAGLQIPTDTRARGRDNFAPRADAQLRADARAPGRGYFNRVTTVSSEESSPLASRYATARANLSGAALAGRQTSIADDDLRPYSARAFNQAGMPSARNDQSSSWGLDIRRPEVQPTDRQPRQHTYFPGLRPAMGVQPPVTLTASTFMIRHICTPSRSRIMPGMMGGLR